MCVCVCVGWATAGCIHPSLYGSYVTPDADGAPLSLPTVAAGQVSIDTNSIADIRAGLVAFNPSFTVNVTPNDATVTRDWDANPVLLANLTGSTQIVTPGFPPASVPVPVDLGDIALFRDPTATPNFAFDIRFDFTQTEVSVRSQGSVVQDGLGVSSVIEEAHLGMFVPIVFDFENAEMEGEVQCDCLDPGAIQSELCDDVCPGPLQGCQVTLFLKLNRLRGWLGIIPTLVEADRNPNIPRGVWVNDLAGDFQPGDPDGATNAGFYLQTFMTSGDGSAASVDGIVYRPKPLALAPLVDAAGYTLALRINDHNLRVKAKRRRHLPYHPASVADLDLQL